MKSLIFIIIIAFFSISSYAQWQINGSNIYYNGGNVGIGLSNPNHKLEITGLANEPTTERTFIKLTNYSLSEYSLVGMRLYAGQNNSFTTLTHLSESYIASPNQADFGQLYSNGAGLMIRTENGIIRFETSKSGATLERMRIDTKGDIGIGTNEPKARLHIADGDIYISEIERGIIMKSPDGQCWRGTLNNEGILIFNSLNCPGTSSTSTNEYESVNGNKITIFPNPSKNYISIKYDKNEFNKLNYTIVDINGKVLTNGIVRSSTKKINISQLKKGVYFISIKDKIGNSIDMEKIIIQ